MGTISQALRGQMAREYEQTSLGDRMTSAASVATGAPRAEHVRLGLLQLLLPDLIAAIERAIVEGADKKPVRAMAGGLLTYVCNPLDLIGDDLPIGRVDDAIICGVGLHRLSELDGVSLDPHVAAICDVATSCLGQLNDDLKESIVDFLSDLERSTHRQGAG